MHLSFTDTFVTIITCYLVRILLRLVHKIESYYYYYYYYYCYTHTHIRFTALFRDHPGKLVPEENFWTLMCKGRLTEADTLTIRLGATPSALTSAHLHHPPIFLQA